MGIITEEEFVNIVNDKKDLMFRLAYSILKKTEDTEDAIAEAVLIAWEKIDQVRTPEHFDNWLLKIAVNTAKTMRLKRNREILVEDIPEDPVFYNEEKPVEIWKYVGQLKYDYMVLIMLFYYYDMSIKEISHMTGVSKGTVKSRLYRAKERLRKMIPSDIYNCYVNREVR